MPPRESGKDGTAPRGEVAFSGIFHLFSEFSLRGTGCRLDSLYFRVLRILMVPDTAPTSDLRIYRSTCFGLDDFLRKDIAPGSLSGSGR